MEPTSWRCPYCNKACTVTDNDVRAISAHGYISKDYGSYHSYLTVITCPNKECRKQKLTLTLSEYIINPSGPDKIGKQLHFWPLLPESEAKPFPEYIPEAIRKDYTEACLIRSKSPKASATLSRRCLQGMISDFWGIKKRNLAKAIEALKGKIAAETWKAIDSVRQVGNIGAHMEAKVNVIIEVDPKEAGLLIWLIETLLTDWYVARHERSTNMAALIQLAEEKKEAKKAAKAAGKPAETPEKAQ